MPPLRLSDTAASPVARVALATSESANVDAGALAHLAGGWEAALGVTIETVGYDVPAGATLESLAADAVVVNPGDQELPEIAVPFVVVGFRGPGGSLARYVDGGVDRISGRGIDGYRWAVRYLCAQAEWPFAVYRYGGGPEQVAELRLPATEGPVPLVVLVHGGGWKHRWQRDLMAPLAVDLARRGYATWNLEFRRVGGGGGWPATFDDVRTGIDILADLAEDVAVDLDRVCFLGHSSGGHLALWAAANVSAVRPGLVVSIAGVTDPVEAARRELIGGENIAAALLGGLPEEVPERYAMASPSAALPLGVPQVLVQGLQDYIPDLVDLTRAYVRAGEAVGDSIRLLELPDADHLGPLEPAGSAWQAIVHEIDAALPVPRRPTVSERR